MSCHKANQTILKKLKIRLLMILKTMTLISKMKFNNNRYIWVSQTSSHIQTFQNLKYHLRNSHLFYWMKKWNPNNHNLNLKNRFKIFMEANKKIRIIILNWNTLNNKKTKRLKNRQQGKNNISLNSIIIMFLLQKPSF
jgi:hypothetical protein